MASIKLDMLNQLVVDVDEPQTLGEYLHELTKDLGVTFDVTHMDYTHEGPVLEFTGRPDALAILIRRYESDPELRAELRDRITYVAPMPGSCES